ncbi:hypothetical protein IMG5_148380, partial [Ichthyophthirius multifiliis]
FIYIIYIYQINCTLKFVTQLFRHGARTPLGSWYDSKQQSQGELTSTGMRQHYNFGRQIREEYKDFLPQKYNHSQIYIRSTDVNRTYLSASSHLQGMFPEGTGELLPLNLLQNYTLPPFKNAKSFFEEGQMEALPHQIQVVPIHSLHAKDDLVLQPDENCLLWKPLQLYIFCIFDHVSIVNIQSVFISKIQIYKMISKAIILGLALRLALIIYAEFQDYYYNLKYTDIDYFVYSDAAKYVMEGKTPYDRHTYRYTPILSYLMIPNWVLYENFGKFLFIIYDILGGILIQKILKQSFCTAQYYIWYMCLMPLILARNEMYFQKKKLFFLLWGIWLASELLWNLGSYYLELQGINVFLYIWMSSLLFFIINCFVICFFLKYQKVMVFKQESKKME